MYIPEEVRKAKEVLEREICAAGGEWYDGRVRMSLYIEKPDHRGDAINFVDVIADVACRTIGVDDRWFEIGEVGWDVVTPARSPRIYLTLEQDVTEHHKFCGDCKRELPVAIFQRGRKRNKLGYQSRCRACHRMRTSLKGLIEELESRGYVVMGNFDLDSVIDLVAYRKPDVLFIFKPLNRTIARERRMEFIELATDCGAIPVMVSRDMKFEVLSERGELAERVVRDAA